MSQTYRAVQHLLQKELLVPINRIHSRKNLKSDLGLSSFELNVLFYHVEEKFHLEIPAVAQDLTVSELVITIENSNTRH